MQCNQGVWKYPRSSKSSPTVPIEQSIGIEFPNVVNMPPEEFWKTLFHSALADENIFVIISGDLIRDRYENFSLPLYPPLSLFISANDSTYFAELMEKFPQTGLDCTLNMRSECGTVEMEFLAPLKRPDLFSFIDDRNTYPIPRLKQG